jgi:putative flippase GtrA
MPIPVPHIARQSLLYLAFGLVQIGIDWLVFVTISAAGTPVLAANLIGRIAGATFGFWANGKVTFSSAETATGPHQAARFFVLWCLMAAASTAVMLLLESQAGLKIAWLAKPFVDLSLSAVSFMASRHWVYRR